MCQSLYTFYRFYHCAVLILIVCASMLLCLSVVLCSVCCVIVLLLCICVKVLCTIDFIIVVIHN